MLDTRLAAALLRAETVLFGSPESKVNTLAFEIDSAFQGKEGLAMVRTVLEQQRDYVESINESARALLSMITNILGVARFELAANQPKITNFSLVSIVGNLKQTFGVKALETNLKLHSSVDRAVLEYLRGYIAL